jgi:hypothetical protein
MNCQQTLSLGFSGYNDQLADRQPHVNRDSASASYTTTIETRVSITMVERVLAALFGAVAILFGSEQAEVSEEDWLHELMAINDMPTSTCRWRLLAGC